MPKKNVDYSRTVIYKICCVNLTITELYVGNTTDFTRRKSEHRRNSKAKYLKIYTTIQANGGWDNWTMVELEKYPCADGNEARSRERYWIEELAAKLNIKRPIVTAEETAEYHKKYNETHKEERREYYETHKEEFKEYYETHKEEIKEYRETHSEKIKAYQKEYENTHKEERKEYHKEYRETYKEEIKEQQAKKYETNKELIKKTHREYYYKNKERILAQRKSKKLINSHI